jgi:hypothetical protein
MIIIIGPMFFFNFEEDIKIKIAVVSFFIAFPISIIIPFRITDKYYTEKRRKLILRKYPKPGGIRYLIVVLMIIGPMAMMAIAMAIILAFINPRLIFG